MKQFRVLVVGLCAAAAMGGCDTVAELTFEEEQLVEAVVQGLADAHCGAPDDDAVLRFSVVTSQDARMTPAKRYGVLQEPLAPGENFTADDILFGNSWIFVVDRATGRDMACASASDCPKGASCATPDEMGLGSYYYAPGRVCAYATDISVDHAPQFTHFRRNPMPENDSVHTMEKLGRAVAFMIDNSATLDGSWFDGVPNAQKASDPYQYRKVGIGQFMDALSVSDESSPRFEFSAIFANGFGTSGVYDISKAWLRTPAQWLSTVMAHFPSPGGASPVWEAAGAAVSKLIDSADADYRKMMVAFTDGAPNDQTDEAFQTFSSQMAAAGAAADLFWIGLESGESEISLRYAEMTALGCGSYYLFENPAQIPQIMRNIAINSESFWSVGVRFSAALPKNALYKLATNLVVRVGTGAVSFEAQRVNQQNETVDNRWVFKK